MRKQVLYSSGNNWLPPLGSGRNFLLGKTGTGPWQVFTVLCSIKHVLLRFSLGTLGQVAAYCSWPMKMGSLLSPAAPFAFQCSTEHSPWPSLGNFDLLPAALVPPIQWEEAFQASRVGPGSAPMSCFLTLVTLSMALVRAPQGRWGSVPAYCIAPPRHHSCPGSFWLSSSPFTIFDVLLGMHSSTLA